MAREGQIKVDYEGELPEELKDHLRAFGQVRIISLHPLTLVTRRPEILLNQILRYLGDGPMEVSRVQLRGIGAA